MSPQVPQHRDGRRVSSVHNLGSTLSVLTTRVSRTNTLVLQSSHFCIQLFFPKKRRWNPRPTDDLHSDCRGGHLEKGNASDCTVWDQSGLRRARKHRKDGAFALRRSWWRTHSRKTRGEFAREATKRGRSCGGDRGDSWVLTTSWGHADAALDSSRQNELNSNVAAGQEVRARELLGEGVLADRGEGLSREAE